ncbi:MAG: hypothetical protein CFE21_15350 [Bacteroidetes bacterium B1(2017)]|nr:MAG: hypothetical protein CFE21_15350 [Bacteroidetes bacterium B1(2017)]
MKKINLLFSFLLVAFVMQAQTVNVTIKVDMTGKTVSADSVHMVGSFNGWNPKANVMLPEGNNIYSCTLSAKPGDDIEYKFMNGNAWGTEESKPTGNCTTGNSGNRILTAPLSDITIPAVLFGSCPTSVATKTITFYVDMADSTVASTGVHVAGNFNGWNPSFTALTKYNGTVYKADAVVLSSILKLQYKFLNGDSWGKDESPGAPCADAASHNRLYRIDTIATAGSLPNYKFNTCTKTTTTGIASVANQFSFAIYPTTSHDFINVKFESVNKEDVNFTIYSISGQVISTENVKRTELSLNKRISVEGLSQGLYLLEVSSNNSKAVQRFLVD